MKSCYGMDDEIKFINEIHGHTDGMGLPGPLDEIDAEVMTTEEQAAYDEYVESMLKAAESAAETISLKVPKLTEIEHKTLEKNVPYDQLKQRGIVPDMSIVPMLLLLSIKTHPDRTFDKAKARQVIAGHAGFVTKGSHFTEVLADAPDVTSTRLLLCIGMAIKATPFQFDVSAAFLQAPCRRITNTQDGRGSFEG
eukprot:SAG22_NODE_339_length_12034_cov_3.087474_3_plen_195_part_00